MTKSAGNPLLSNDTISNKKVALILAVKVALPVVAIVVTQVVMNRMNRDESTSE